MLYCTHNSQELLYKNNPKTKQMATVKKNTQAHTEKPKSTW